VNKLIQPTVTDARAADILFDMKCDAMLRDIEQAEASADAPIAVPDPDACEMDIEKIINDKLIAKFNVRDMKVDHGILFGRKSPYYGMIWWPSMIADGKPSCA